MPKQNRCKRNNLHREQAVFIGIYIITMAKQGS